MPDVFVLIGNLQRGSPYQRQVAAEALGWLGDAHAVPPLCDALRDENGNVRTEAARALGKLGDQRAVLPLCDGLNDRNRYVVRAVAEALGQLRDESAAESLCAQLVERNDDSRTWITAALVRIGAPAVKRLCDVLASADPFGRGQAAIALGEIADASAAAALLAALQDRNVQVRRHAAIALGRLGDARAVRVLCDAFSDPSWGVRRQAQDALCEIRAGAVQPLCALLRTGNANARSWAAETLLRLRLPSAILPLCHALTDTDVQVRREAAELLREIGDNSAIDPLCESLGDEARAVRIRAAAALAAIAERSPALALLTAVSPLQRLADSPDEDDDARSSYQSALARLQRALGTFGNLPATAGATAPDTRDLPVTADCGTVASLENLPRTAAESGA